jgi:hypothetical protein
LNTVSAAVKLSKIFEYSLLPSRKYDGPDYSCAAAKDYISEVGIRKVRGRFYFAHSRTKYMKTTITARSMSQMAAET